MNYVIGRHINGISLNGLEYLVDSITGERVLFESEENAINFLKEMGYTTEQIDNNIVIKEQYSYGKSMLDSGEITSLDKWSEQKERVLSFMDRSMDYLWDEDEKGGGITFIDRLYDSNIRDERTRERERNGELILHFNSYNEVEEWIKKRVSK